MPCLLKALAVTIFVGLLLPMSCNQANKPLPPAPKFQSLSHKAEPSSFPIFSLSPQVHHCLPGPVLYYFSHELLQLPSIITFFLLLFSITDSFLYNSIWFLLCWRKEGFGVLGQSLYDGFSKNPQTLALVLSDTGIFLAQFTLERAGIPWTKAYALMTSARELSGSRKAHSLTIFTFFLKYNHLWKAFTGHLSENWIPTGPDTPFSASFPS